MPLTPIPLSISLAFITTTILLILGTPLAWFLSQSRGKIKSLIEAVIMLPLVLPPTSIGFYLLILLSPSSAIGKFWHSLTGQSLSFSFTGLVIGSVIYSLPFVVKPIQNSFESIEKHWLEIAATLRASKRDRFLSIVFPLAKGGFISAALLGFTHTLGEFGVVLMMGGNIPGKTQTVSIAIYDYVETMKYGEAHFLSLVLLIFSFSALAILFFYGGKKV
jgi:molybdate transport system permease protein